MTDFKVGDRVRVADDFASRTSLEEYKRLAGRQGTVVVSDECGLKIQFENLKRRFLFWSDELVSA